MGIALATAGGSLAAGVVIGWVLARTRSQAGLKERAERAERALQEEAARAQAAIAAAQQSAKRDVAAMQAEMTSRVERLKAEQRAETEKLARHYSPLVFTSFAILVSALAIILHGAIAGEKLLGYPAPVYWYTFAMAIFCTVLPSLLVAQGIALIGSNRAAILSTLGPVMTIYLAYTVLGDEITVAQTIGTICVLAGIALLTVKGGRKKQKVEQHG